MTTVSDETHKGKEDRQSNDLANAVNILYLTHQQPREGKGIRIGCPQQDHAFGLALDYRQHTLQEYVVIAGEFMVTEDIVRHPRS